MSGSVKKSYNHTLVVPCCTECNVTLGNRGDLNGHYTIGTKADYLADCYSSKYRDYISGQRGNIEEDEIDEYSGNIKIMMEQDFHFRKIVTDRMEFLEVVGNMSPSIDDVWDAISEESASVFEE